MKKHCFCVNQTNNRSTYGRSLSQPLTPITNTKPLSPSGEVRCEPPNNRLDKFKGILSLEGQTYALDNDKVLLRGCTLRNTEWCFGLVIFGGKLISHQLLANGR